MHKRYLQAAALSGAIAVILGAFGAHSLKGMSSITPEIYSAFQTGVQYQFYHTLALLATVILYDRSPSKYFQRAAICFITGIILFAGSLYLLTAIRAADMVGMKGIGILTPVGGLFFIAGWIFLFAGTFRKN